MQMRIEKRAFGDSNSNVGVMTFVFSWTFSKEYSTTCCWGNSWQGTTGESLQLSPNGTTATLNTFNMPNYNANMVYAMDSNNKTQEEAFSGVWDHAHRQGPASSPIPSAESATSCSPDGAPITSSPTSPVSRLACQRGQLLRNLERSTLNRSAAGAERVPLVQQQRLLLCRLPDQFDRDVSPAALLRKREQPAARS